MSTSPPPIDAPLEIQRAALDSGRATSAALVEAALERIGADGAGWEVEPGVGPAFTLVDAEGARAEALVADARRQRGLTPSPLAGLTVSLKDLFDVAGQVTTAGSRVLARRPPARADAPVVQRLRAAGAIVIGRTNMTEFAFSGLGLNPHFGTPANPRAPGRIPGGSSSGAAVSVAIGAAAVAIGTDTGGSLRIPAALCGLVGFKPTQARVPRDGLVPLSWSLDTVGPIAASVAGCALADAVLAGEEAGWMGPGPEGGGPVAGLRLGVPTTLVLDGLDAQVAAGFAQALSRLSAAGARVVEVAQPVLAKVVEVNAQGGFAAAEAYAWHRDLLANDADAYDPRVRARIARGAEQSAADYILLSRARRALIAEAEAAGQGFDALVMPTVPVVAPRLADLAEDADYARLNMLMLRNPSFWNFLDRPALSLPVPGTELPVGLMLVGRRGHDRSLLRLAGAVEALFADAGQAPRASA